MKKLLITILTIIILIFIYNQYKDYKRFHPDNVNYKINENVDLDYFDTSIVYNYYDAIETLNGFVLMQWCANEIDVRNPNDDDRTTSYAVNEYAKRLAKVKFYEGKLIQSNRLKTKGLSNKEIKYFVEYGISEEEYIARQKAEKFKKMLHDNIPLGIIKAGQSSAFIFEIQKLLVKKGYDIPVDGVFESITANAIADFETKNNLFVDGNIDEITLEELLK